MFPSAGLDGWRPVNETDDSAPLALPLPVPYEGYYYDPNVAPGVVAIPQGNAPVAVGLSVGDFEIIAIAGRNSGLDPLLHTTLRQNVTFGFVLLDSLLPPPLDAAVPDEGAACTMAFVLRRAQEDSGIAYQRVTSGSAFSAHIIRYRQRLLARLITSWQDSEDEGGLELNLPSGAGWGFNWGFGWGSGGGDTIALPALEAIWLLEARRVSDGAWVTVNVVSHWDNEAMGDPALMIRQDELVLLRPSLWFGVYDRLKVFGVAVPDSTVDFWAEELPPNVLLGSVFCYCLCLEGARFLAMKGDQLERVASLTADLSAAQRDLMRQAASHRRLLTTREG